MKVVGFVLFHTAVQLRVLDNEDDHDQNDDDSGQGDE